MTESCADQGISPLTSAVSGCRYNSLVQRRGLGGTRRRYRASVPGAEARYKAVCGEREREATRRKREREGERAERR
eukprot:1496734-Rhodomonas_salina.1